MEIAYVVTDSRTWEVELDWLATSFDMAYYQKLLEKAWKEMQFAFGQAWGTGMDRSPGGGGAP